ncbi:cbb3-type cytochrome oxidase assembly protein CcoS [Halomonas sp. 328]|uniref:cbb3-type cytochrome oxidase assembly protein CcoS n=1 Tax=Halomonas sp. 328 TaxID=2776704 RepID=UPI0018A74398|nr:cbb3-type cytochrome oxidase assembly protein CcoS [Halomonas sp. 328]MBF8221786.1 cbb3-type cytochrome oxidase assembly protein CcoS [Halomonas sp. 328]
MTILYLLIPLSLILLSLAIWAFFWAVKNDQFEDLEGPAYRILFDEDENDLPREQRDQGRPESDDKASRSDGKAASDDAPEPPR